MKSVNSFFLVLLISLACSGGRGDIITPGGGGPSPGASRANLAVTWDNLLPAFEEFNGLLINMLDQTLSVVSKANDPEIQYRIMGNYNGYIIAQIVEPVIKPDSLCTSAADSLYLLPDSACTMHLHVKFINYFSQTGKLFLSKELDLYAQWGCKINSSDGVHKFYIDGTSEFSGDYACTVLFDEYKMSISGGQIDSMQAMVPEYRPYYGRITVFSEGADPLLFNPFFK